MSEHIIDSITSGVVTQEELDSEPYGFRVSWIRWNSGFRKTGLRIGDRVLACNGTRYEREHRKEFHHKAFGSYSESQYWAEIGAKDGQQVVITVKRGREVLDIEGWVFNERNYRNESGRMTIGPGGPDRLATDGFQGPWMGWLEKQIEDFGTRVLDGGWVRGTVPNSRQMLEQHMSEKARVDFLTKNSPGPFADAVAEDWQAIRENLEGREYPIKPDELAWRALGEQRAGEVAAKGKAAKEAFLKTIAADLISPFPAVDPIHGERETVAGKIVALPPLGNKDWVMNAGKAWLAAGDRREGWYFVDSQARPMQTAVAAQWRYQKAVAPNLGEVYEIIGRIGPDPKMLVRDNTAIPGLHVEPLAVMIGGAAFVDVRSPDARFAGEEDLDAAALALALQESAPPEEVMNTFVRALKLGDEPFWRELFALWDASRAEGRAWYRPASGPRTLNSLSSEWVRARRLLEKAVYDIRVVDVGETETIISPNDFEGAPSIEQVVVEVDHVGLFDGQYRAFKDVNTNRLWPMQRRDGGPWRITIAKGI